MTIIPYRPVKNLCHYVSFMLYVSGGILDSAIKCFMINVPPEILVHSLANFHSQKEYRHMNLQFMWCTNEWWQIISQFVSVKKQINICFNVHMSVGRHAMLTPFSFTFGCSGNCQWQKIMSHVIFLMFVINRKSNKLISKITQRKCVCRLVWNYVSTIVW